MTAIDALHDLLVHLRAAIQTQANALDLEDFEAVAQAGRERDLLTAALEQYHARDLQPEDRLILEQIGALDQRLIASARQGMDQANLSMRSLFRGQGALRKYQRRGQALIGALHQLDVAR